MKLIKYIPNKLFKSKKTRSISRSDNPSSFGSVSSSSSNGLSTPRTVLPELSKQELESILTRFGLPDPDPPTEEEMNQLLTTTALTDGGGELLKDAFDFFDVNLDGKITAEELFNVFKSIGDFTCTLEDCKRMIRGVDKNGDGFVCFEDFSLMMDQHIVS